MKKESEALINRFQGIKKHLDERLQDAEDRTYVQNYLYLVCGPLFNYTEAIIILCREGKYNAGAALIRCLFEAHINIIYHQTGDSKRRLAISAKHQAVENRKIVVGILKLIEDYPNQESSNTSALFNKIYLNQRLEEINRTIDSISQPNDLRKDDKDPKLIEKAKACDSEDINEAEPRHFQGMYELVYRYLSPYVHLNIQGLQAFVVKNDAGKLVFQENVDESTLISQSVAICIALARDLYENEVLIGDAPAIITDPL